MLYAIVPLATQPLNPLAANNRLKKKIIEIEKRYSRNTADLVKSVNQFYTKESPNIYFIYYQGTSEDLFDEIGFIKDKKLGFGVILQVNYFHGYGPNRLWEWLNVHRDGERNDSR